jgi:hypothetical protein
MNVTMRLVTSCKPLDEVYWAIKIESNKLKSNLHSTKLQHNISSTHALDSWDLLQPVLLFPGVWRQYA